MRSGIRFAKGGGIAEIMRYELIHIRPATRNDSRMLYEWRNDEGTRQASAVTTPLTWEEHERWMEKTLSGGFTGRSLYIIESDSLQPIGSVRSDVRSDGLTEVSYTISPPWRGKGVGKRAIVQFAHEYLSGKKLAARIKKGMNPASEKIAAALGLSPFSEITAERPDEPPMVEWR